MKLLVIAGAAIYTGWNLFEAAGLTYEEFRLKRLGWRVFGVDYWVALVLLLVIGCPLHVGYGITNWFSKRRKR